MDIQSLVLLSSVAGAGLFTGVGFLANRVLFPQKAGPSPELQSALQGEKEARHRAEEQAKALERQHEEGARQLAEERSQAAQLRAKLQTEGRAAEQLHNEARLREQAQQEVQRLAAIVSRLEGEASQVRASRPSVDTKPLADENARLRAQVTQLGGDMEAFRVRLQQREAELNDSRAQLASAMAQKPAGPAQAAPNAAVKQLEAKVAELTRKSSETDAKQRELTTQLTAAQTKAQQLATVQQQLAAAQAQAKSAQQLQAQLTAAQAQVREAQRMAQQLADIQQQLAAAQAQVKDSQPVAQELMATQAQMRELREKLSTAEGRSQEAPRLKDENAALRQQINDLKKAHEPQQGMAEIQRRNVELSLKARALEQRSQEFEMQATEIESLRTKVDQLQSAANETAALRARVRDLEARGYADRAAKGEGTLRRPARVKPNEEQRLENLLEGNLEALVKEETGCRTAVLADLRGLLIAASGDITYQDELAAASSLTTYTTERIRQLIPMGEPLAIQFIDVNRVVLRIEWLRWQNDAFLLSTLGVAPETGAEREDRVQTIMSELLGS
jgi:hypothetical protein